jgi:hypothetical protein
VLQLRLRYRAIDIYNVGTLVGVVALDESLVGFVCEAVGRVRRGRDGRAPSWRG